MPSRRSRSAFVRRQGGGTAGREPERRRLHRLRRPQRVRLYDPGDRAGTRLQGTWDGISYRDADGKLVHNKDRAMIENMDSLPFVTDVYKRGPTDRGLFHRLSDCTRTSRSTPGGAANRAAPSACGPQTVGGHRYRTRSPGHVAAEIAAAQKMFPQVREFFFDDDHLHRRPAARRGHCARAGQARRHLVVQREGQCAARGRSRC